MKHIAPAALAALILAACTPSPAPAPARQAEAPAPAAADPAPTPQVDACERVGALVDDLMQRKSTGLTEREALAELSARGDYRLGYVVDGVFTAKPDTAAAITRADILATCRRVEKTGTTY